MNNRLTKGSLHKRPTAAFTSAQMAAQKMESEAIATTSNKPIVMTPTIPKTVKMNREKGVYMTNRTALLLAAFILYTGCEDKSTGDSAPHTNIGSTVNLVAQAETVAEY